MLTSKLAPFIIAPINRADFQVGGQVIATGTGARVFCVVPVFNRMLATVECIRCLRAQTFRPLTIIVADGGSNDGTQEYLRREHADVILLEGRDLWWGGATRLGIDWALEHSTSDSDFVLLVNNDTAFDQHYVKTLVEHCRRHNAAISGVILDANSPDRILHAGINIEWSTYSFHGVREIPGDQKIKLDCCVLPGRGTLIPIHAVRRVGNVDDARFPHYLADYEFTYRLRVIGGIRLGVAYDAAIRTPLEEPIRDSGGNLFSGVSNALMQSFSRRSKRNFFYHCRFIDRHAPRSTKRRLKLLLVARHFKRLVSISGAISPVGSFIRYCRRCAVFAFGTYLIPAYDLDQLGPDRLRLSRDKIITKSRHPAYFYPSCSRRYVQLHYPEALGLYQRARNPLRKIVRLIDARFLNSTLARRDSGRLARRI
jgi:GT2 family glycosyltransferase